MPRTIAQNLKLYTPVGAGFKPAPTLVAVLDPSGIRSLEHGTRLPGGFHEGTPTSLRFTGKLFGEREILRLAHAFQMATDHHLQHPPL